jgi:hypothetical protein
LNAVVPSYAAGGTAADRRYAGRHISEAFLNEVPLVQTAEQLAINA